MQENGVLLRQSAGQIAYHDAENIQLVGVAHNVGGKACIGIQHLGQAVPVVQKHSTLGQIAHSPALFFQKTAVAHGLKAQHGMVHRLGIEKGTVPLELREAPAVVVQGGKHSGAAELGILRFLLQRRSFALQQA